MRVRRTDGRMDRRMGGQVDSYIEGQTSYREGVKVLNYIRGAIYNLLHFGDKSTISSQFSHLTHDQLED